MSPTTLQPQRSIKMLLSLTSVLLCTLLFFSLGEASLTTSLRRQPQQQQQQASKISIVDTNKKTAKSLSSSSSLYVPIYVMMPLDLVSLNGALNNLDHVTSQLRQLKSVGVDGIMIDVWWGIVQKDGYQKFNWSPYDQLFALCKTIGLKIQANLAFHQCGTNVGDSCYIPLPAWVMAEKSTVPDGLFYKDREGHQDEEYLSLGTDTVPLFQGGRLTSVDLYAEFMSSFQKRYASWIGVDNLISSIEIGLGPAGELRYPSYQLQNNIWSFPGIGEFQCYDKYMLQSLNRSAYAAGHPEWSHGGPMDAGQYNSQPPSSVPFFADGGWNNWESDYGKFFVSWYSKQLIAHGDRILSRAFSIFVQSANNTMSKPTIAAKIAGIHWWYNTRSHAAELTAGYYNTDKYDGYTDIAQMLKKYDAEFAFTCLEMLDQNQQNCNCAPQELVQETRNAAWSTGVRFSGENALPIYNYQAGYDQIVSQSVYNGRAIDSFTYLRLDDQLFQGNAWNMFSNFVSRMHNL